MRAILVALVMAFCVMSTAVAGPYEDGAAAYSRGEYATALGRLRLLAGQGDAAAQTYLGNMHVNGKGVTQDYGLAAEWYRRAAE